MKTILDSVKWLFLENILSGDDLLVTLIEAFTIDKPEKTVIAGVDIGISHPIDTTKDSRRFIVRFASPFAWSVVEETYFNVRKESDETTDDSGYIQVVEGAEYYKYLLTNHYLFENIAESTKLYRLCTLDYIIDVVTRKPPIVTLRGPEVKEGGKPRPN